MRIFNRRCIQLRAGSASSLLKNWQHALLIGFSLSFPVAVQAQVDCDKTNEVVSKISFIIDDPEAPERNYIKDALRKPDILLLECVLLQEFKINQPNRVPTLTNAFHPFTDTAAKLPLDTIFTNCKESTCRYQPAIQELLMTVCRQDLDSVKDKAECDKLKKPVVVINNHYERKPLPTWRRVVGGIAIGLGAGTAILGAIHMGIPVFSSSGGCTEYGLDYPCLTASRFGAGFSLLGVGLVVAGGGIFALAWPTGESLNKVKSP